MHTAAVERYAQNILGALPDGAVLVVAEDYLYAGTQYVQWALDERPDVIVIDSGLLQFPWYRDAARATGRDRCRPARRPAAGSWSTRSPTASACSSTSRKKTCSTHLPTFPYGAVLAVQAPPPLDELVALNRELFGAFVLDYAPPGPDDEYASVIQRHYAAMWEMLARALDAAGRHTDAEALRRERP